jgi:hypothetical protein
MKQWKCLIGLDHTFYPKFNVVSIGTDRSNQFVVLQKEYTDANTTPDLKGTILCLMTNGWELTRNHYSCVSLNYNTGGVFCAY